MKSYIKPLNEFLKTGRFAAPITKPDIDTPAPTVPKPDRPFRPSTVPSTTPRPIAGFEEVMDRFFDELESIKDTPKGKAMIKKLHSKYVK
jgi:hypothetical protein